MQHHVGVQLEIAGMILNVQGACFVSAVVLGLASVAAPRVALTQSSLRSSFSRCRVGGGIQGECSSWILDHLVPCNRVFAPGSGQLLGLLQSLSRQPVSLTINFTPKQGGQATIRTLPASRPV